MRNVGENSQLTIAAPGGDALILAAGHGTRMRATPEQPKPLATLAGRPLVDHVMEQLTLAGARHLVVGIRPEHQSLESHLNSYSGPVSITIVKLSTTGGADTLRLLMPYGASEFMISTADSIVPMRAVEVFAKKVRTANCDVCLAIVPRIKEAGSDVGVSLDGVRITDLGRHLQESRFIIEGPMWMSRDSALGLVEGYSNADRSLTSLFRHLLASGVTFRAIPIMFAMDIDTVEDIAIAERRVGGVKIGEL